MVGRAQPESVKGPTKQQAKAKTHVSNPTGPNYQNLLHIQQKADDFFKRNRIKNIAGVPTETTGKDRKPAADTKIEWAWVMNFEEVLVDAIRFFRELGATTPSIDANTMVELIMGQYVIAKRKDDEHWLREARHWAITFFPTGG